MNRNLDIIKVISPALCNGEYKNQDRAGFSHLTLTACLCDGVSSSPYADKAAELIVDFSAVLFDNHPARQLEILAKILFNKRLTAIDDGVNLTGQPDSMQTLMQEVAYQKLQNSFQSTLVASQFIPGKDYIRGRFISCGDSGIFVFSYQGQLLFSNMDRDALNQHGCITAVLPDHFQSGQWEYTEAIYPPRSSCLLCSDGFYRCFADTTQIWRFLNRYRASSRKKKFCEYLHRKLHRTTGDDDISFIWILPVDTISYTTSVKDEITISFEGHFDTPSEVASDTPSDDNNLTTLRHPCDSSGVDYAS